MSDDRKIEQLERQLGSRRQPGEQSEMFSMRPEGGVVIVQPISMAPSKPKEKD